MSQFSFVNKAVFWMVGICLVAFTTGCRDNRMVVPASAPCTLPDTVSFQGHIVPLLSQNCALPDCHSGNSPQGNLNLEAAKAYSQLMKKGSGYIDTIRPQNSVLYSSLVSVTDPMPPTGKLNSCDIQLIVNWMAQKAKNN